MILMALRLGGAGALSLAATDSGPSITVLRGQGGRTQARALGIIRNRRESQAGRSIGDTCRGRRRGAGEMRLVLFRKQAGTAAGAEEL